MDTSKSPAGKSKSAPRMSIGKDAPESHSSTPAGSTEPGRGRPGKRGLQSVVAKPSPAAKSAVPVLSGKAAALRRLKLGDAGQFEVLVSNIAKTYGVTVAAKPRAVKNPFAMSASEALKIARKAGIITKTGKLAATYK